MDGTRLMNKFLQCSQLLYRLGCYGWNTSKERSLRRKTKKKKKNKVEKIQLANLANLGSLVSKNTALPPLISKETAACTVLSVPHAI